MTSRLDKKFNVQATRSLRSDFKSTATIRNRPLSLDDLHEGRDILFDVCAADGEFRSRIDAISKTVGKSAAGSFHYEPILFSRDARISKTQKLSLAFRAYALGRLQAKSPDYGTVLFGGDLKRSRVRLAPFSKSISPIIDSVRSQIEGDHVPTLSLNRHCHVCPFIAHCHKEAQEADHLSLLRGITPTEIARHNRNGIFTVTQLSYTFRARRRPKRAKPGPQPHSYALQALALRENTVYIHGSPNLPTAGTRIYFDVEGTPNDNRDYLIGILVDQNGAEQCQYFWAANPEQELDIFVSFIETLQRHEDYQLFHYGSYERGVLKRMLSRLPPEHHNAIEQIQERAVNVLPIVYSHVYFPVWSNSLKEVAGCLGFEWNAGKVDGLQSIVWRERWAQTLIRLGFVSRRFPDYVPQTTSSISISLPERN